MSNSIDLAEARELVSTIQTSFVHLLDIVSGLAFPTWLNQEQTARYIGETPRILRRKIAKGTFPPADNDKSKWLIDVVEDWIDAPDKEAFVKSLRKNDRSSG